MANAKAAEIVTRASPRRRGTGIGNSSPARTKADRTTNSAGRSHVPVTRPRQEHQRGRRQSGDERGVEDERARRRLPAGVRTQHAPHGCQPISQAILWPAACATTLGGLTRGCDPRRPLGPRGRRRTTGEHESHPHCDKHRTRPPPPRTVDNPTHALPHFLSAYAPGDTDCFVRLSTSSAPPPAHSIGHSSRGVPNPKS